MKDKVVILPIILHPIKLMDKILIPQYEVQKMHYVCNSEYFE